MRQIDFISLIHKDLTGEILPEESALLKKWLEESKENQNTYADVKAIWVSSQDYQAPFTPNVSAAFNKFQERINKEEASQEETKVFSLHRTRWIGAVAASMIVLVSALVIWNHNKSIEVDAFNEVVQVELEDGTEVWLNKGSRLAYKESYGKSNRAVVLDGEAFFDVAENENLPFTIEAGELHVEVLGTAFNVRSNDFAVPSVAVQRGKVKVVKDEEEITLTGGQYVVVKNDVLEQVNMTDNNEFMWKSGQIAFNNSTLNNVLDDLASFYNRPFSAAENLPDCRITITQPIAVEFATMMNLLEAAYDMEWSENAEGEVYITSLQCD